MDRIKRKINTDLFHMQNIKQTNKQAHRYKELQRTGWRLPEEGEEYEKWVNYLCF